MLDPGRRWARWFCAHQSVDVVCAIAVGIAVWQLSPGWGLASADLSARRAFYQSSAAIGATLLGLTLTSLSVIVSNMDKPIGGSPKGAPRVVVLGISKAMFGLIRGLALVVGFGVFLLATDITGGALPSYVSAAAGGLLLACALRLLRVLLLMSNFVAARTIL